MESLLRLDCSIGQFSAVCMPSSLGRSAVSVQDPSGSPPAGSPRGTSVFKKHPYKVCRPVPSASCSCIQAPSEQPQGPASFVSDSDGVRLPSGI